MPQKFYPRSCRARASCGRMLFNFFENHTPISAMLPEQANYQANLDPAIRVAAYHGNMDVNEQMRSDWNRRAREDVHFYVAFGRRSQEEQEFLASAAEVTSALEAEFSRLPPSGPENRSALEIGCGPGRLMRPMSRHFGEIHGVDISDEMVRLACDQLKDIPHAHVLVTPDSSLGMFRDGSFDFVYSYIVFQHIPNRDVVLNYLREAGRVLKPGGLLRCQLRGTPPLDSEMEHESTTWTGCHFSGDEVAAFARERHLQLVALSGLQTQYMWVTLRKPPALLPSPDFSHVILKAVTAASSGKRSVPERGRESAVSLWIEGMPEAADLAVLAAGFDGVLQQGCYISPIGENGGCQFDVLLPRGIRTGSVPVTLRHHEGAMIAGPVPIEVTPGPPWEPKVLSVTDGINILSKFRVEKGGVKVTIEDIEHPEEVSFLVDGRAAEYLQYECKDPITFTYEFAFHPSPKVKNGERRLDISISGRALPPVSLQVARD
jgi:SAM-dependent methyltransferase